MNKRTTLVCALSVAAWLTMGCSAKPSTQVASSPAAPGPTSSTGPLSLVVIGDSIPDTKQDECPGCTGFVTQYANALSKATGRQVTTVNKSEHTGLRLPGLLGKLPTLKGELSTADAIIVGIAHNSIPLSDDVPCGSTFDWATATMQDWSRINPACADEATKKYGPLYDQLYSSIAGWRKGHPTILLTINKYSDWVGWKDAHLTEEQAAKTVMMHDAWNTMLCDSARRNGFSCADIYHAFNGPDGHKPSGDLLGADYTHPSQKGNDQITRVLLAQGFGPIQ